MLCADVTVLLLDLSQGIEIGLDNGQACASVLNCTCQDVVLTRVAAVDGLGSEVLELVLSRDGPLLACEDAFFVVLDGGTPVMEASLTCLDVDSAGRDRLVFVVIGGCCLCWRLQRSQHFGLRSFLFRFPPADS